MNTSMSWMCIWWYCFFDSSQVFQYAEDYYWFCELVFIVLVLRGVVIHFAGWSVNWRYLACVVSCWQQVWVVYTRRYLDVWTTHPMTGTTCLPRTSLRAQRWPCFSTPLSSAMLLSRFTLPDVPPFLNTYIYLYLCHRWVGLMFWLVSVCQQNNTNSCRWIFMIFREWVDYKSEKTCLNVESDLERVLDAELNMVYIETALSNVSPM